MQDESELWLLKLPGLPEPPGPPGPQDPQDSQDLPDPKDSKDPYRQKHRAPTGHGWNQGKRHTQLPNIKYKQAKFKKSFLCLHVGSIENVKSHKMKN